MSPGFGRRVGGGRSCATLAAAMCRYGAMMTFNAWVLAASPNVR